MRQQIQFVYGKINFFRHRTEKSSGHPQAEERSPKTNNFLLSQIVTWLFILAMILIFLQENGLHAEIISKKPRIPKERIETVVHPEFLLKCKTETVSIDAPKTLDFTIMITKTGKQPLSQFRIAAPLLTNLSQRQGDISNPGNLDTGEIWTYTGSYIVDQKIIDENKSVKITVTVDFAETAPPQSITLSIPIIKGLKAPLFTTAATAAAVTSGAIAASQKNSRNGLTAKKSKPGEVNDAVSSQKNGKTVTDEAKKKNASQIAIPAAASLTMGKRVASKKEQRQKPVQDSKNEPPKNKTQQSSAPQETTNNAEKQNTRAAALASASPMFNLTYAADHNSVDAPGAMSYTIKIENTGDLPLSGIRLSDPLLDSINGPHEDTGTPQVLDIDETWIYTGNYTLAQNVLDGNGVNENNIIDGSGAISNIVYVSFAETGVQSARSTVNVIQKPDYTVKKEADPPSIDEPANIHYTIHIQNTGNISLTQIRISDPLLENLNGPQGDDIHPGILDVGETWIYTGDYPVTQAVIDANGVDANNRMDGDGDIDSTTMVGFAEIETPKTAYTAVLTKPSITGDIFEKKNRYLHGFLSATRAYTTNLYKTDNNPEDCWSTMVTPGIWMTFPSNMKRSVEIITQNASPGGLAIEPFNPSFFQRFQAYFLYSPSLEMYHGQSHKAYQDPNLGGKIIDDGTADQAADEISELTGQDSLDRLTHRFDAMLHYYSGNRLSVKAIDQYKISYDAFSVRAYVTDDKFKSNMFNMAGTLDLTEKLQFRLDYSNFYLNYEDNFNRDADRMDNSYSAYAFFRLTAKTSVFAEYDFADIDYQSSNKDSHEHRYFAGLRWEMSGKSSGQIKGGFGKKTSTDSPMIDTDVAISDISQSNWMAAIQLDHNFTSRTNVTLNAYRRYDEVLEHRYDFGIINKFYADYTLAHFAGVKFSWKALSNLHLNLDTSLFYDEFINSRRIDREGIQNDREDWEFAVSPSVTIDIWEHFSLNGAYIYTDHDSNYPEHDYFDHTFFVRASGFF